MVARWWSDHQEQFGAQCLTQGQISVQGMGSMANDYARSVSTHILKRQFVELNQNKTGELFSELKSIVLVNGIH